MCVDFAKDGYKIVSNLDLTGVKYEEINWDKVIACEYHDCVIFIDEAHQFLPARGSLSIQSKYLVDGFMSMISKANIILILNTQYPQKVDCRIILEKNYNILCEKRIWNGVDWVYTNLDAKQLKNTPTIIIVMIEDCFTMLVSKEVLFANDFYKYYNRYQIIDAMKSIRLSALRMREKEKIDAKRIRIELENADTD
jgi:hypothetical protein